MMAALGVGLLPSAFRTLGRRASWTRSHVPSCLHSRKYHHTVPQGGRSCGMARHVQPLRRTYTMPLTTSRRSTAGRRRLCSEVSISKSCSRRSTRARSSRVRSSGRGRTGGLIASANSANTWASMASVLASWPLAWAKLRTWRGLTNDTGSPASSSSLATNVSYPPVASSTTPRGSRGTSWSTIEAMPSASLVYCLASSVGSIATSSCLDYTSIPTYTCAASGITTPPLGYLYAPFRPSLATFALSSRGSIGAHNCSGSGSLGRGDLAEPRSNLTKNETICHVHT